MVQLGSKLLKFKLLESDWNAYNIGVQCLLKTTIFAYYGHLEML